MDPYPPLSLSLSLSLPVQESYEEEVDPRAAETSVPIDEHPFLAALKEGPKVGADP